MNATLNGYKLTKIIYQGVKTVIYSGVRESDRAKVIVKTLKAEYPTLEAIVRLRHEYKILLNLDLEGVVKAYSLEDYKNGLALVLEHFDGSSIKELINSQKIPLLSFLSIAIQLASAIADLHKNHIIHKDIKPQNILINLETWQIKIIDFSIATYLEKETPTISNPNSVEGTLIYMSPEQTGRMNRAVDYRTDFYSLGVTFYELLTGVLPFDATEPLELVHCHIAKTPVPPHKLNPEIPEAVSDIVMKLMAKTAENRYQSALGLKADLEICFDRVQTTGKIENFTPGQLDKSGQFSIPQKLYGRDRDVRALMEAFERVSNRHNRETVSAELVLVSGYSGIGKSCLVNEVHKPIVAARGYFIAGKFDQLKRNIPYAAFIQAFSELIRQLLTENSVNITWWKEKILEALGENGQVIVDVIPEVEKIVGKQPVAIKLGPSESQNRFNRIFLKFIQVFASAEHPLVIFLDDLQWADSASLKLIELLMTDAESNNLLLIGAYRDNEVSPTHATIGAIEKIKLAGVVVNYIVLQPLDLEHVAELVADTVGENLTPQPSYLLALGEPDFYSPPLVGEWLLEEKLNSYSPPLVGEWLGERLKPLAELLFNKTGGNPFFLTQMLSTLYQEKLLTFDFSEGRWLWDIENIQALAITDYNVVELVARNIQKLPESTQQVLKLAACIGNRFNLDVLAIVNEKSMLAIADALWDALQSGLVLPLSDAYKIPLIMGNEELESDRSQSNPFPIANYPLAITTISYKFLHDRVQQAAYSLIPEEQKKSTHLSVGKLLLQKTAKIALEENIFDIVNQLNIGVDFIAKQSEKDELAGLNLIAGKKAIASNAPVAAARYLNVGLQILAANSWEIHYDLTLALHIETIAAEYLCTNYERGALLSGEVLNHAKTLLEKVPVYENKILFYISQNQLQEAIATALQVLKMLAIDLPEKPNNLHVIVSLIQTKLTLGRKRIADLIDLPELTDPYKLAALQILKAVAAPAFIANPSIGFLAILTMVKLSIKYGNSPVAAFGYVFYGMFLCGPLADTESGYQFGQLAWKLLDKFEANALKAKVSSMLYGYIIPWKKHAKATIEPFREAVQIGLETGDIEYAGYSALSYCTSLLLMGEHLDAVAQQYAHYIALTQKIKQEFAIGYQKIWKQLVLNLQGLTEDKYRLMGESFNEEVSLPELIQSNNGTSLFAVYLAKTILCYFLKDGDRAVENAALAAKYAASAGGLMLPAELNFYYSLAMLAKIRNTELKKEKKQYLKQVASHQKQLKKWASRAPENFQHKYDLVEAVRREVLGQDDKAAILYDRAIAGAREQEYTHELALACELAAEFYLGKDREQIAKTYLTDAYYGYIRWGAKSKVNDLEERYPDIFSRLFAKESVGIDLTRTTTSTTDSLTAVLDLVTVMKASQALGEEIYLDKLLDKLMQILIENAGARKGLLFLRAKASPGNDAGKFLLVAEGGVEKEKVVVMPSVPIEERPDLPVTIVNYVERTQETVVLNDATVAGIFSKDAYIRRTQPKSILGWPLIYQGKLTGILYLENNLTAGTFTQQRVEVLKLLCASAASALQNASLYQELQTSYSDLETKNTALQESEARERLKAEQLEQSLYKLQQTQAQLVQTEKISSLGQLVAGVAHEVNNPVNFISGNLRYAKQYVEDLVKHLQLYEQYYPNPSAEIAEHAEAIELDYLIEDLPKMLASMHLGTDRIRDIMQSLRNFSRVDEGAKKPADLHSGIDSTLMILSSRLKGKGDRKAIQVVKEYENLPSVECYSGLLNQVFMNLMANAIDAIEEGIRLEIMDNRQENGNYPLPITNYPLPTIRIRTEVLDTNKVAIRIKDNGPGMSEEVRAKLFSPFFTTKPVGKGTGLGLSISHQIVVEKHQGSLQCISAPAQGTEFIIEIPIRSLCQEAGDSQRDSSEERASSTLPQISA